MKTIISAAIAISFACLLGCTFHAPTMSDLLDQNRQVNEERIALRECERNSGAIGSVAQCQQRAKSWRVPNQATSSVQKLESVDVKRPPQE